jgi:exosortase C (VPDSG-CTERM-specific)
MTPRRLVIGFWVTIFVLIALFSRTLSNVLTFAIHSDLESHIPLIPFISAYLFFLRRDKCVAPPRMAVLPATVITLAGLGLLGLHAILGHCGVIEGPADRLVLPVAALVTLVIGTYVFFFSTEGFRLAAFPLLFLFVMVPIPEPVAHWMRVSLQHWSAEAAYGMFMLTGTPIFREGLVFHMSGLTVEVAEECSGIHSSLVLFITSLVAGHLFLRKRWTSVALVVFVIPLGVLRNGFRVLTISLLTIHVDPNIINGPLHHRGGPIFFALSLGVFLGLLWLLRWSEGKRLTSQQSRV